MKGHTDMLQKTAQLMQQLSLAEKNRQQANTLINESIDVSRRDDDHIERFCHTIAVGVSSPFPRSQQQLTCAVIGIKNALKKISLVELLDRNPHVKNTPSASLRAQIKPIEALDKLLSQPLFQQALPNLWQAARYMHERDQQDVQAILNLKLPSQMSS